MSTKREKKTQNKGYWLGKKRSEETKKKLSEKNKGKRNSISTEFKKGNSGYWLGKKRYPETVQKMREAMTGKKHTQETRRKLLLISRKQEDNPLWRGKDAGYVAKHLWVKRHKGAPLICTFCKCDKVPEGKARWFEWANISGEYKRDLDDYISLCLPCHKRMDKRRKADRRAIYFSAFGETKRICEWAEDSRCVVEYSALSRRIFKYGYPTELALTKPSIRQST